MSDDEDWTTSNSLAKELEITDADLKIYKNLEQNAEKTKVQTENPEEKLSRRQRRLKRKLLSETNPLDQDKNLLSEKLAKKEPEIAKLDENGLTRKQRKNLRARERRKNNNKTKDKDVGDKGEEENVSKSVTETSKNYNERRKEMRRQIQLEKKKESQERNQNINTDISSEKPDDLPDAIIPTESDNKINEKLKKSTQQTKLEGARFRILNQKLYSITSNDASTMFKNNKRLAKIYHEGYTEQVKKWPSNPVFNIIQYLSKKASNNYSAKNPLQVVDLGCGDAKIARSVFLSRLAEFESFEEYQKQENQNTSNPIKSNEEWDKLHKDTYQIESSIANKIDIKSFDLYALNRYINIADMKNTKLPKNSIDVTIFCLSLMGTNLYEFIAEANRILKIGGFLKIAEVRSRFGNKEKSGVAKFIKGVASVGFYFNKKSEINKVALDPENNPNSHFLFLEFKKIKCVDRGKVNEVSKGQMKLEPCIYKKR